MIPPRGPKTVDDGSKLVTRALSSVVSREELVLANVGVAVELDDSTDKEDDLT